MWYAMTSPEMTTRMANKSPNWIDLRWEMGTADECPHSGQVPGSGLMSGRVSSRTSSTAWLICSWVRSSSAEPQPRHVLMESATALHDHLQRRSTANPSPDDYRRIGRLEANRRARRLSCFHGHTALPSHRG